MLRPQRPQLRGKDCFRTWGRLALGAVTLYLAATPGMSNPTERLLYSATAGLESTLGTRWRLVTDAVMGGISGGRMDLAQQAGTPCLALAGEVRLENNGGFVQIALDLDSGSGPLDARGYTGLQLRVRGNGEEYGVHLRTPELYLPWQSYRAGLRATPEWQEVRLAFRNFTPYRTDRPLATDRLSRLGVVAIGRAFTAGVCIAQLSLYRD